MKRTVISFLCICALMLGCVPLAGVWECRCNINALFIFYTLNTLI